MFVPSGKYIFFLDMSEFSRVPFGCTFLQTYRVLCVCCFIIFCCIFFHHSFLLVEMFAVFKLHPRIPRLFFGKNWFLAYLGQIKRYNSSKYAKMTVLLVWLFVVSFEFSHLLKLTSYLWHQTVFMSKKTMLENFTVFVRNNEDLLNGLFKSLKN